MALKPSISGVECPRAPGWAPRLRPTRKLLILFMRARESNLVRPVGKTVTWVAFPFNPAWPVAALTGVRGPVSLLDRPATRHESRDWLGTYALIPREFGEIGSVS